MQTHAERGHGKDAEGYNLHRSIFDTFGWNDRRRAIQARVSKRVAASQARAAARRAAAQPKILPMWRQRLNAQLESMRARRAARNAAYQAKHSNA